VREILLVIVKRVLLVAAGLALLVLLSFLFTGGLTSESLSERLVWTGIACIMIGGVLVMGQTMGGRDYGVPGMFVRSAHAQALIDWNIEIRQNIAKRMDFTIQLFLAGLIVFGVGALVSVLTS
jgi:hypothetical protein